MRRVGSVAVAVLSLAAANAAGAAEGDVFAGYSYQAVEGGGLHGWGAGFGYHVARRVWLAADFSGHYGTPEGVDMNRLAFLGGLRFDLVRGESLSLAAYGLAGGLRAEAGISVFGVSISENETGFAWAAGAQADFALSKRWAIRVRGDYLSASLGGETQGKPRFAAGAVLKLGE